EREQRQPVSPSTSTLLEQKSKQIQPLKPQPFTSNWETNHSCEHQEAVGESSVFRAGSLNRLSSSMLSKDTSRVLGLCRSTTLSAAAKRLSLNKQDRSAAPADNLSVPKLGQDKDERLAKES